MAKLRFMRPEDWARVDIGRGSYFNKEHAITGYRRADGLPGNALHPACTFEDRLRATHQKLREAYPDVRVSRYHVRMPYWAFDDPRLPGNYAFVAAPERLTTTSITVVMVSQDQVRRAGMGYYYDGQTLAPLRARMQGTRFRGLAGNLGYYMTEALIVNGRIPWAHNARFPDFPLPVTRSYIGFHLFPDAESGEMRGAFQGAHPAAVGLRRDGCVEILPRLDIAAYKVTLGGKEFFVKSINDPHAVDDVMVFTPGWWTPEMGAQVVNWQTCAPEIPVPNRINVFVANAGNGQVPVEKVVQVWEGRAPVPSFGAVLSFAKSSFPFGAGDVIGQEVRVEPLGGTHFDDYAQMMGGFVPAVVDGQHVYCVDTVEQVRQRLHAYGNALSPIAECGKESRNFDLRIREPAGMLVQTRERIGWVLFDGRHELSIGASVVDAAKMLKLLEGEGAFGGPVEQAVFVDGGSAMKVYAVESDGAHVTLDILNRVAAGSRNGPGADPDGLNLYTLLALAL